MVCNTQGRPAGTGRSGGGRNPLTGLSGLQLQGRGIILSATGTASQSPYGAKWFATKLTVEVVTWNQWERRRNPLTGLSGLQLRACTSSVLTAPRLSSRNPLTGLSGLQHLPPLPAPMLVRPPSQSPYGAKWFATLGRLRHGSPPVRSQSPYGAKWFATWRTCSFATWAAASSRNPLTGLSGLQPMARKRHHHTGSRVAIPLRG